MALHVIADCRLASQVGHLQPLARALTRTFKWRIHIENGHRRRRIDTTLRFTHYQFVALFGLQGRRPDTHGRLNRSRQAGDIQRGGSHEARHVDQIQIGVNIDEFKSKFSSVTRLPFSRTGASLPCHGELPKALEKENLRRSVGPIGGDSSNRALPHPNPWPMYKNR